MCVWNASNYTPSLTSTNTKFRGGQQKTQGTLKSTSVCVCLLDSATERSSGSTWVVWGRFSVSHKVGVNVVCLTDTYSNSVPVLDLRPPWAKITGYTKTSYYLPHAHRSLSWSGVSGSCQERLAVFIRPKETKILPWEGWALYLSVTCVREEMPHPRATRTQSYLNLSWLSWRAQT